MADPIEVQRCPWWRRGSVLSAAIFVALLLNNSEAIFRTPLYETDDYAADSLQVLKAKQFRETLGNYCRFGFHHPGPAFFYVFGWGEILFHDATHIVPTPFNGQLIALYALSAFFFGATVALVAARTGPAAGWFVGLALLFAAWHFGAVGKFYAFIPGNLAFFVPWMPCFIVLPFLCFLVAAASVAAGGGKDLPLMVLAACFLVHGHVGMPLQVVPLTLVAYGGFWLDTNRRGQRPWKLFRRQHWLAAAIIALFLAPLVINLFTAHPNNLALIIEHLRTSYGERKGFVRSLFYFTHFGAYATYPSRDSIPALETFDAAGVRSFFLVHWRAYVLWLASILLVGATTRSAVPPDPAQERIQHLRRRMCLILAVAIGLSLVWGSIQEGPMFYYNALFNFAIYYGWLLIVALSLAVWIERRTSSWRSGMRIAGMLALTLLAAAAFGRERRNFRATPDGNEQRFFAAAVERALVLDPAQPKYFNFDWQGGGLTTRVALYLERRGIRWWVREDWPLLFGEERIIRSGKADPPAPTLSSSFWRISLRSNPAKTEGDPDAIVVPLTSEFDLVIHPGK
ncbi:MAG: hypothetical protein ABR611_07180 [Chthoniobacterales bacterium]